MNLFCYAPHSEPAVKFLENIAAANGKLHLIHNVDDTRMLSSVRDPVFFHNGAPDDILARVKAHGAVIVTIDDLFARAASLRTRATP